MVQESAIAVVSCPFMKLNEVILIICGIKWENGTVLALEYCASTLNAFVPEEIVREGKETNSILNTEPRT